MKVLGLGFVRCNEIYFIMIDVLKSKLLSVVKQSVKVQTLENLKHIIAAQPYKSPINHQNCKGTNKYLKDMKV